MGCTSSSQVNSSDSSKRGDGASEAVVYKFDKPIEWMQIHSAMRWNKNQPEIIAMLKHSSDVAHLPDPKTGNKPLHIAAQNGHLDLVKILIDYKADVNEGNNKGQTPLHMAVGYDYYDVVVALKGAGADENICNSAEIPAHAGLEGDKSIGFCCLVNAKTKGDAEKAFTMLKERPGKLSKAEYVKVGLGLKKTIDGWPQDSFKEILAML